MVNHGRSAGCLTCKQRRVKCDEAKPACRACKRLALCCQGYAKPAYAKQRYARLQFKDQTHKFVGAGASQDHHIHRPTDTHFQNQNTVIGPSGPNASVNADAHDNTAVMFYLHHYANVGRDMASSRGFFEMLIPVYFAQSRGSALSLAVSALASAVYSMWSHDPTSFRTLAGSYSRAITRLRTATQDPVECAEPATILAVLVLQTYENASAVFGLRRASSIHHDGAASLLPCLDTDHADLTMRAYLRRFMLHTEVSTAIRQNKPLAPAAYSWLGSKDMADVPENYSSALDAIGVSVAELQSRYTHFIVQGTGSVCSGHFLDEWKTDAQSVDVRLLMWAKSVPIHWRPSQLVSVRDFDSSIPSFRSRCDVYPSCQVASIWNLWRFHRILLIKMTLDLIDAFSAQRCFVPAGQNGTSQQSYLVDRRAILQKMVDSVCYSVPFYLGNRTKRSSLTDFTDASILLAVESPCKNGTLHDRYRLGVADSRDDYRRHIIAQGPWRAMHPLSSLLTLFSGDSGEVVTGSLRPGQRDWIRIQLSRVATLLHLPPRSHGCTEKSEPLDGRKAAGAEFLARDLRKGAIFMSGP